MAMAEVVFIHGIGQQKWKSGQKLQRQWLKALRKSEKDSKAQESTEQARLSVDDAMERSAMVFYGDLFIRPGAQGDDPRNVDWSEEELVLAEQLAEAWIAEKKAHGETVPVEEKSLIVQIEIADALLSP